MTTQVDTRTTLAGPRALASDVGQSLVKSRRSLGVGHLNLSSREVEARCEACDQPATQSRLRFCSDKCRCWARLHPGEKRPTGRTCRGCSTAIDHTITKAIYCTQACGQRHRDNLAKRSPLRRPCAQCGVAFAPARSNTTCCSLAHYKAWFQKQRAARQKAVAFLPFTADQLVARLSMFRGCWMCGGTADQIDHVKPLVAGGWHILANLRPACGSCNSRKGGRWPLVA